MFLWEVIYERRGVGLVKKRKGFALQEILVALVVISIIMSGAVWCISVTLTTAKFNLTKHDMTELLNAHSAYYVKNNAFTTDADLVTKNYIKPGAMWNGTSMIDRFGNALVRSVSGTTITISISDDTKAKLGGTAYSVSFTGS